MQGPSGVNNAVAKVRFRLDQFLFLYVVLVRCVATV